MGSVLLGMIFLPAAGALLVLAIGSRFPLLVRQATLATTAVTLFVALFIVVAFPTDNRQKPTSYHPIRPAMEWRMPWMDVTIPTEDGQRSPQFEFYLGMDGISLWLVFLTALLSFTCVLVSWKSVTQQVVAYHALLLALETGMLGVFCAFDIILFYVFFEFTLLPLFFLIGIWGGPERVYAAGKFFIYTLAGSVLTLVGVVALVLCVHHRDPSTLTFSIPELASAVQREMRIAEGTLGNDPIAASEAKLFWYSAQAWIFLAMFAGFAIKVPLAPFHTWLPLAHVEAPTAGSVLLAGVLLKLGSYGFLRLCLPMLPYACWNVGVPLVATLSVIGILYGALCALAQNDIKRLVAYSSVSHLGFCMLGMFALNAEGISGSTLQMINHGLSTGALFLLVGMLYERYHTRALSDLGGLASRLPVLTFFMVFTCLSSLGLPGLNGFVGEVLALIGMYKARPVYAILGLAGIILGAWYLLSMVRQSFFGPVRGVVEHESAVEDLCPRELCALVPIALLCVWLGVYPESALRPMRDDVAAVARIYQQADRLAAPTEVRQRVSEEH